MSEINDTDYLRDIQVAADRIADYVGVMPYEAFVEDSKTQDAVVRNLEIIGEAVKNLSRELRAKHADVPWRNIAGIRDRLIHAYFGVNLDIVWRVVTKELPAVASRIAEILGEE